MTTGPSPCHTGQVAALLAGLFLFGIPWMLLDGLRDGLAGNESAASWDVAEPWYHIIGAEVTFCSASPEPDTDVCLRMSATHRRDELECWVRHLEHRIGVGLLERFRAQ